MAFTATFLYLFRLQLNIITTSIFKCSMDVKLKYVQVNNGGDILLQLTILLTVNKLVSLSLCL